MADKFAITEGKIQKPLLVLIYGIDKVGKTSFAASAPKPIFLDLENGSELSDVARLPMPSNFNEAVEMVKYVATLPQYQTLVVDSIDWLESICFKEVVAENDKMVSSIAEIPFGKGYPRAVVKWKEFIDALNVVRDSGKNIILIGHAVVKKFEDPTAPAGYDRYQLKLYDGSTTSKTDSTADLFKQYVDCILFATFKIYPNNDDPRRAYGDGTRVVYTERRPAHDAGNRLGLPYEMSLDWETFIQEANPKKGESEAKLRQTIQDMLPKIKDETVRKKIEEALPKKKSVSELAQLKTKAEAYL